MTRFALWGSSIVVAVAGTVVAFALLSEWWRIGVVADPTVVAQYHFGSESMTAHGGFKYKFAALYSWSALFFGAGFVAVALAALVAAAKRSTGLLVGSGVAFAVLLAINVV
jgi:hypothetical protein